MVSSSHSSLPVGHYYGEYIILAKRFMPGKTLRKDSYMSDMYTIL